MTKPRSSAGELLSMMPDDARVRLEYLIPDPRPHRLPDGVPDDHGRYGLALPHLRRLRARAKGEIGQRINGALVSMVTGKALGYALFNLQERGALFIGHGVEVYEGMIIGIHSRDNDLMVNPTKGKQLTNIRSAGADENIILTPPIKFSLEQALEFIDDDELVEVTPATIRLRKKLLTENERKREQRKAADG